MYDDQIVRLFFDRSEQALLETQKKYGSYARRIVDNILPSEEDSDECLNDVYLTLWNKIPPEQPKSLKAFVGTIARNAAISKYRTVHAEKRGGGALLSLSELEECVDRRSIEDELQTRSLTELLNSFLAELPKEARVIFVKRYWYLSSVQQISEEMGCGEGKVKMSLHRTRKKLKDYLKEEGYSI